MRDPNEVRPTQPWNRGPGLRPLLWTYVIGWSVLGLLAWWACS
ncbi:MAG: hypothetical protein JWO52_3482 [Gammaproteobacteria bacterium]|nr:hypothetical protein [Gammaproteobacteria bacterium]